MPSLLPLRPVHAALRNSASKKQSHEPSWSEEQAGHRQRRESTRAWADGGRGLISSRPLPVPPKARISIPHLPHLLPLARQGFGETGRRSEAVWSPHPPSPAAPSTRRPAPASPDWAPGLRTAPAHAQGSRGGRGSRAGWGRADSGLLRQWPREGILDAAPPPHVCAAQGRVPPS